MVKFIEVSSVVLLIVSIKVLYIIESNDESLNYSKAIRGEA